MEATSVKKATRLEFSAPKTKHLLALKNMTLDNPASIDTILSCLEKRMNERSWVVTFKVLGVLHFIMREGNCVRAVDGIIKRQGVLDTSKIKNKNSSPANVKNIYLYRAYLDERVVAFRHVRKDYIHEIKNKDGGQLRHLSITDGLLREISALQRQLDSALECKFYFQEKDPRITIFAYKMVLKDIIAVFHSINEGVVNMLEHYFKMNKSDAKQALSIYNKFTQQTEATIDYLNGARNMETDLQMDIPHIEHAPLTLQASLEAYLKNDAPLKENKSTTSLQSSTTESLPIATPQQLQMDDYFSVDQITAPLHRQLSLVTDQSMSSGSITPISPDSVNSSNPFLNFMQSNHHSQGFVGLQKFNTQPSPVDNNPFRSLSISSDTHHHHHHALYKTTFLQSPVYDNAFMPLTPPLTPDPTTVNFFSRRPDFVYSSNPFMQPNGANNHHHM